MPRSPFSNWLENQYLDWQKAQGRRVPLIEFAGFLGVANTTVVQWMNGDRKPSAENADVLAYKLQDMSIYALLGLPRPDPLLLRLKMEWHTLPEETQAHIGKLLEKAEQTSERGAKRTSKRAAAPK